MKSKSNRLVDLRVLIALIVTLVTFGCAAGDGGDAPDAAVELAPTEHVIEELAPGVYWANSVGTGKILLMSNALFIVNDEEVFVVDSHVTPDAARSLIAAIRTVTDKPIRQLVNTHYHFDHAHGNQEFTDNVAIIGHEYTRAKLSGDVLSERTYASIGAPETQQPQIDALGAQVADAADDAKAGLEAQLAMMKRHQEALSEVVPTPPNTTLTKRMTVWSGDREIQILHLGRGHTGGDVVVYLPAEKIAFTGDLFYAGAPYLGDGYANEFPDTLEKLKALDVEQFVTGHGPVVTDKAQIDFNQEYLRKYWGQVSASHAAGKSVEEAIAELDMAGYEEFAAFQQIPAVRTNEVTRMYEVLDGTAE